MIKITDYIISLIVGTGRGRVKTDLKLGGVCQACGVVVGVQHESRHVQWHFEMDAR